MKGNRLKGKAAIVTGGAGGIGAAVAELFRAQGAQVLAVDLAGGAEVFKGDVAKEATADQAVARALNAFGRLDVLVNNAAVRDLAPISEGKAKNWSKVLEVNVLGALNFMRAAMPALRKSKGCIVNVSSAYALRGRRGFAAYDASKAAILAMTRSAAAGEAPYGVRVNAVCPGGTLTPFTVGRAKSSGKTAADLRKDVKSDSLLGRWAEPAEIAWPILWLASDEASYITGAVLPVDGGPAGPDYAAAWAGVPPAR